MPVSLLPLRPTSDRFAELDALIVAKDRHGLRGTYINDKCRCARCLAANRQYLRDWRLARAHDARKAAGA